MMFRNRCLALLLALFFVLTHSPQVAAGIPGQSAQNKPQIISSAEEDFRAAGAESVSKGNSKKWLWSVLAVLAIGAVVGMGGGGGGGNDAGVSTSSGEDGSITAGW